LFPARDFAAACANVENIKFDLLKEIWMENINMQKEI